MNKICNIRWKLTRIDQQKGLIQVVVDEELNVWGLSQSYVEHINPNEMLSHNM